MFQFEAKVKEVFEVVEKVVVERNKEKEEGVGEGGKQE